MQAPLQQVPVSPGLAFSLVKERVQALTCGGLWWEASSVLVMSDLHLEKGSSYAARGQMLPPYDTRATLGRVIRLVEALQPATVILLGDSFHDPRARARMSPDDVAALRRLTNLSDWVWIEGNHDPAPPADLGGRTAFELTIGTITFRHVPSEGSAPGEVAGHLHPCARVVGRGGRSVRKRCFVTAAGQGIATGRQRRGLSQRRPPSTAASASCERPATGLDSVHAMGIPASTDAMSGKRNVVSNW